MSVIGKLFWNDHFISTVNDHSEKEKLLVQFNEMSAKITADMSSDNRELLDEMLSTKNAMHCYDVEDAFCLGFKSAVRILFESYKDYFDNTKAGN